jgi:hypothetical protein
MLIPLVGLFGPLVLAYLQVLGLTPTLLTAIIGGIIAFAGGIFNVYMEVGHSYPIFPKSSQNETDTLSCILGVSGFVMALVCSIWFFI